MSLHPAGPHRLLARLEELARIGATADGGVTRVAYSPADRAAQALVGGWMREAGLAVSVDGAGNLIGWHTPEAGRVDGQPPIVMGSHLDSVVNGGALDGAYGVVAAVEVAGRLVRDGFTGRPFAVVAFANEEGSGGLPAMTGSRAFAGQAVDPEETDDQGRTLAQLLGNDLDLPAARWVGPLGAYWELHIEQGPVLERAGATIGVVTAITGRRTYQVDITGQARHAGTTPMDARRDALTAAARVVLAAEGMATAGVVRVATCGFLHVSPNVRNVVPGGARLAVELRDDDALRLDQGEEQLRRFCEELAAASGCSVELSCTGGVAPVGTDARLQAALGRSAAALGLAALELPSGAGHDAQLVAALGPVGMIFVPSRDGISHAPTEFTEGAQLMAGADTLYHVFAETDRLLG